VTDTVLSRYSELANLSTAQIAWLLSEGIQPAALSCGDVPVAARILPRPDGLFDFPDEANRGEDAKPGLVFLYREPDGSATDLVGWLPRSGWLGTWLNRAALLGDPLGPRLDHAGALPVWRSPMNWLRAGREGVVILDPVRAAYRIHDAGPVLAEDPDHAAEIDRALNRLLPAILLHNRSEAA
jgi:hypothetical protein